MNLIIFHNTKNLSNNLYDLTFKAREVDLTEGEIFIGYHKPIKNIYVEMESRIDEDDFIDDEIKLSLVKKDGEELLTDVFDRTYGLTRSGFISWNKSTVQTEQFGVKAYWIKLTTANPEAIKVNGINLVLSDDNDLTGIFPDVREYLPSNKKSFIGFHQEAMKRIVQDVRSSGKTIKDNLTLKTRLVDQFDLLNIEEFKQASKYLALHLLYSWFSRDDSDKWEDKKKDAYVDYQASFNYQLVSVDTNDNGKDDEPDSDKATFIRIRNV